MALTNIEISNQALVKLGARTIQNFTDNTAEAQTAAVFFDPLVDALLSAHPWGFATQQVSLTRSVTDPIADYQYAYDLPADFLRVISAGSGSRGQGLRYKVFQNKLYTDAEDVILTYIFRPDETDFPPFFDQVVVARLSAELCIPLTESTSRAKTLFGFAEDEFKKAKLIDAQQDTPVSINDFALIDARS